MAGNVVAAATGLVGLVGGLIVGSKKLGGVKPKRYVLLSQNNLSAPPFPGCCLFRVSAEKVKSAPLFWRFPRGHKKSPTAVNARTHHTDTNTTRPRRDKQLTNPPPMSTKTPLSSSDRRHTITSLRPVSEPKMLSPIESRAPVCLPLPPLRKTSHRVCRCISLVADGTSVTTFF